MPMTSIDDLELPKSIVARIIKQQLPDGVQIQKDAKTAFNRASTFANDNCKAANLKIINAKHILKAIEDINMPELLPELMIRFEEYKKVQKVKKDLKQQHSRRHVTGEEKAEGNEEEEEGEDTVVLEEDDEEEEDVDIDDGINDDDNEEAIDDDSLKAGEFGMSLINDDNVLVEKSNKDNESMNDDMEDKDLKRKLKIDPMDISLANKIQRTDQD